MHSITEPLRLAVGSHSAGSGKGCAMNIISWENGDKRITDFPACADPLLAKIVQRVNDAICSHSTDDLLCPACSMVVLELGHRTVGTGHLPLSDLEKRVIYTKIAIDQARQVQHLVPEHRKETAAAAIEAAERWTHNPTDPELIQACRKYAATAAAYAAATAAATAATAAATAAAYAAATAAAYAAATAYAATAAAYAATAAAYAAAYAADATAAAYAADAAVREQGPVARLALAQRAFDLFEDLTGHVPVEVTDEQIADAYRSMTCTAN